MVFGREPCATVYAKDSLTTVEAHLRHLLGGRDMQPELQMLLEQIGWLVGTRAAFPELLAAAGLRERRHCEALEHSPLNGLPVFDLYGRRQLVGDQETSEVPEI